MAGDTVLLVEDDAVLRVVFAEALEAAGYFAVPVTNAAAALRVLRAIVVDLILLDCGTGPMPDLDFVRAARAVAPGARILLWSGWFDADARARATGADGALEKPTDFAAMRERVRRELGAT